MCCIVCTRITGCMPWYWHLHCPSPHLQAYNHIVTSCYKSVPSCPLAIDPSCAQQVRFGVGSLTRLQNVLQITVLSLHACKNFAFRIPNHQIPINPALQHSSWAVLPCHRDLLAQPNCLFFQKPEFDMNVASGFPKFPVASSLVYCAPLNVIEYKWMGTKCLQMYHHWRLCYICSIAVLSVA